MNGFTASEKLIAGARLCPGLDRFGFSALQAMAIMVVFVAIRVARFASAMDVM